MHKSIVAAGAAALILLAGCNGEEKRLEGELSLSAARVAELEQAVKQTDMRADSLANSLTMVEQTAQHIRDSLKNSREQLSAATVKSQRTEARLQAERNMNRKSLDSLNQVRLALENTVQEGEAMAKNLDTQLQAALTDADKLRATKDSLLAFIDDVRPWFAYYKQDSGRNWAKKLVGAGRAKKPATAEPAFQPRIEPNLEAKRAPDVTL